MNKSGIQILMIVLLVLVYKPYAGASVSNGVSISARIDRLLSSFNVQPHIAIQGKPVRSMLTGPGIHIEDCKNYPYHNQRSPAQGYMELASDIRAGLRIGLHNLAGNGPMGPLHPYHTKQAVLLLDILESKQKKVFRCVEDQTFAYAIAKPPPEMFKQHENDKVIHDIAYPGVAIDTYRLSGFLTRKHEPSTYRDFFKLDDHQIAEHLGGKPQRMERLHRYKNLKALVFHEMVHWLGHAHTNMRPDVVDLYETCFFAGSDFIADPDNNRKFQQRACNILKDSELWDASEKRQARLWHTKGYDQLKQDMRKMYD
jgi:hypothetical protein